MLQSITGNSFVVMIVLVFAAVVLTLQGLYLLWNSNRGPEARKLKQRLTALSLSSDRTPQAQLLKQRMLSDLPTLERALLSIPRARGLERFIAQAGLTWSVARLILSSAVLGAGGCLLMVAAAKQSLLFGAVVGVVFALLPLLYVERKRSRRLGRIEQQLPDALELMARGLRAGHAFGAGLRMVGEELPEPIANEFRIVHDEVNFGVSLQQALTNLTERIPLTDLRYFVVAVLIQRESGGNLTEILANLSRLIRERLKLLARVRVLSSEGRLSAWILGIMPFALAGVMNIFNPQFVSTLWKDPIGISISKTMLILMAIGIVVLVKITKIRV